jgi:hypothetical protein
MWQWHCQVVVQLPYLSSARHVVLQLHFMLNGTVPLHAGVLLSCAGDVNCLKVPQDVDDLSILFLTDILPTAWHATEMGEVHEGDVVAIWGAGPGGHEACLVPELGKACAASRWRVIVSGHKPGYHAAVARIMQ